LTLVVLVTWFVKVRHVTTGVPNLSLTMYPFSIPTGGHVPLQNFER